MTMKNEITNNKIPPRVQYPKRSWQSCQFPTLGIFAFCGGFLLEDIDMNYKQRCKEQIKRAIEKEPNNRFYQSIEVYFKTHGKITPAQFKAINKF